MDKNYAEYLINKIREDYNFISEDFSRTWSHIWEEIKFLFDDYVKAGDRVLFTKYGPSEIKVEYKEYLIAKEEDILAILE